ncbi:MAG: hypothetical protein ABMB14_22500 [Myxococcota bacterium]
MKSIVAALREIWGLFVEDPGFTVGMLVALAVGGVVTRVDVLPPVVRGGLLFGAFAGVLVENVVRTARARRRTGR